MGWKAVKDHYGIKHFVHLDKDGNLCIGSPYALVIQRITPDGQFLKDDVKESNPDLARYRDEIMADPEKFAELFSIDDVFENSVTVYTYKDGRILEKLCEEPGYSNVTHDGEFMYDNTHSTDKDAIIAAAKEEVDASVRIARETVEDAQAKLDERFALLKQYERERDMLMSEYPDTTAAAPR